MTLSYRNGVSIAELVVYIPSLFIAIYLVFRHGFRRSSGWIFLVFFCLIRIIGPCMELATIKSPDNIGLYTGSSILNSIGISPLELATLGLLSRLIESIRKSYNTFLHPRILRLVELVVIVGLILGIVGGIDAGNNFETTGQYHPVTIGKVGAGLLIASYAAIVIFTAVVSMIVSHAEPGEKRLFLAVAIALPFLLVRIVYSGLSTFSGKHKYNILTGNTTIFLCVALIEEFIVVVAFEATGLTLQQQVKEYHVEAQHVNPNQTKQGKGAGNIALNIAKKTIIGRLITMVVSSAKKDKDVEMQPASSTEES